MTTEQDTEDRHMARPTNLTPETREKIVQALSAGNTRKAAYAYAGISDETFANWCRRNLDFLDSVARAEASAEVRCVAVIVKAAQGAPTRRQAL